MSDVNSWDRVEGLNLLAHLEAEGDVIEALGQQVLDATKDLADDGSRAGAEWIEQTEAEIHGISRAATIVTAQVRNYGDVRTAIDDYGANMIRGNRD
ncbi:hypothetical protein [Mycolicibacterium houstonense]|uniref:hypothetical protein n=1 Tax=Mycolicibacterium houstonense TaxID=146021 RepID=UPI003F9D5C14